SLMMSDDLPFDGHARLFPLPNLVCFPQVVQPLHIFEPRYRAMTEDALAGDRRIALVLPRPGWETDYDGRPSVHSIACLGKIVAFALSLDAEFKQELLAELNVGARACKLIERLSQTADSGSTPDVERKFPPEFSVN